MNDLQALFSPRSVALVGVPRGFKVGKLFLMGLLDQGFQGPIYLVNPNATEIDGLPCYPRVADIPGSLDMVIVMVPREQVPAVLEECVVRRARSVVLYTSGYGETGNRQGRQEEERIRQMARKGGFRVLGPNCMGIYSPGAGLAFFPQLPRTEGPVGFVTQSGSLGNLFVRACAERKVFFRHVVSCGNGCDVDLPELLGWMGEQPDIDLLCAYCEGVREGRSLARVLKALAGRKPLVMWKVGRTPAGRRAAASHTGALAGNEVLWDSLFRQYGVLEVSDLEEMMDLVMVLYHLRCDGQGRVVILSGPGGPAVSAADATGRWGLTLACLEARTEARLKAILPPTGTSWKNPVDVGLSASFEIDLYLDTVRVLAEDPNVDAIVVLGAGASEELNRAYIEGLAGIRKASSKALLAVAMPGFVTMDGWLTPLCEAGIPVFPTAERALRAYARMQQYLSFRERSRDQQG